MENWDPPDAPMLPPEPALYDARSIMVLKPTAGGASRETVICPACVAIRRKKKAGSRHSLVWGECLRAIPPIPEADGPIPPIAVNHEDAPEMGTPEEPEEDLFGCTNDGCINNGIANDGMNTEDEALIAQ